MSVRTMIDAGVLLDKAADLLDAEGWCQGRARGPSGQRCAVTAIHRASSALWAGDEPLDAEFAAIDAVLDILGGDIRASLVDMNDDPEMTAERMTAAMRTAAHELRNSRET